MILDDHGFLINIEGHKIDGLYCRLSRVLIKWISSEFRISTEWIGCNTYMYIASNSRHMVANSIQEMIENGLSHKWTTFFFRVWNTRNRFRFILSNSVGDTVYESKGVKGLNTGTRIRSLRNKFRGLWIDIAHTHTHTNRVETQIVWDHRYNHLLIN